MGCSSWFCLRSGHGTSKDQGSGEVVSEIDGGVDAMANGFWMIFHVDRGWKSAVTSARRLSTSVVEGDGDGARLNMERHYVDNLVGQLCHVLEALGVTTGSQHHPYVGGQSLEEKFAEESSVRGGRVVSEQLLHPAE